MTGSLSLFRLTLHDSGQYSVSITTEGGSASGSGSVTLQVLDPVSVPTIQSNVTNPVEFNDTVTLTCTASGSDISCWWFNGSSEVSDTQRIHLSADKRTLTISGVLRSDDGPFYCYVYNHVSNGTSKPFSLNVKSQSNPTAQFQWFLNGISLNKRGQELEIRNIQVDQAGNYTCWAFNDVTLRYAAVHKVIDVIEPVSDVEIRPSPPEPIKNHTFSLTCEAAHTQSFLWLKDGKPLVFNGRISLTENDQTVFFQQVLHSDEGVYQCTASNMVSNMASKGFTLILNTPLPGAVFTTEKLAGMIIGSFLGGVLLAVIAFLVANSIRRGPLCRKVSNIKADINESPSSTYENVLNTNRMF
ncbi:carcinoembryonic antigen-related cell adhesion molecule 5-like [Polypterus senegalus]|uniref:carcinoembryonic antigen-related cell adhesion molecule 5-like n=1 Tax=Polypterus senegalus TaxID=55291 RepID=UPI0019627614|nr:carcinoembryonic antigen-related cell adhesion molecule 5-like [Polypterus senegalus]